MSSPDKPNVAVRRNNSRKRKPQIRSATVQFNGVRSWLDEFLAVVLAGVGLFLLVAIVSYRWQLMYGDPNLLTTLPEVASDLGDEQSVEGSDTSFESQSYLSQGIQSKGIQSKGIQSKGDQIGMPNLLGPVGHVVATLAFGAVGWGVLALVALLFWGARAIWVHGDLEEGWYRQLRVSGFSGVLLILLGAAVAMNITIGRTGGGLVGNTLGSPLTNLVGNYGAGSVAAVLVLVGMALFSGQTIPQTVARLVFSSFKLLLWVVVGAPIIAWQVVSTVFHLVVALFSKLGDWMDQRRKARILRAAQVSREQSSKSLNYFESSESQQNYALDISPRPSIPAKQARLSGSKETERSPNSTDSLVDQIEEEEQEQQYVVVQRRTAHDAAAQLRKVREESVEEDEKFATYQFPELSLLVPGEESVGGENDDELRDKSKLIESKLADFGIEGRVTHVHPGPVITLFEFEPAPGVKVGRIAALQDDLAMSLKASSIRIIAPIPRRGTVGIEVPNRNRDVVRLRDVLESKAFTESDSILSIPIGKDTYGEPVVVDIASMPHLLMAGATGTGKSVCINSILISLLYRASPQELGLILIDPKILELSIYEGIPHLRVPVVTVPRQAKAVLDWAVREMNRRYRFMQRFGVRNIDSYNRVVAGESEPDISISQERLKELIQLSEEQVIQAGTVGEPGLEGEEAQPEQLELGMEKLKPLPKIVIVIDELADLMLTVGREIEEQITKLAQKARAAGIHLILATQRPSVDVVTGLIKANFPARISFRVTSRIDSRTILDSMGSERLLGKGDMLFMLPGAEALRRVHGAFVSDAEVKRVVDAVKATCSPQFDQGIIALCEKALQEDLAREAGTENGGSSEEDYDEVYDKAVEFVVGRGQASTSMIQRAFRIGYNRAARLIDRMERDGVVGPMDGARPRGVLVPNRLGNLSGDGGEELQ